MIADAAENPHTAGSTKRACSPHAIALWAECRDNSGAGADGSRRGHRMRSALVHLRDADHRRALNPCGH